MISTHCFLSLLVILCLGTAVHSSAGEHKTVRNVDETQKDVEMRQGVRGLIMDSSGRPVVGALVVPKALGRITPPIPEIAITSDSTGRYSWRLPPGSYEITVSAPGFHSATQQITVGSGQETTKDFILRSTP